MQFGIFTVGDIAPDPTTGYTQSEAERIDNIVRVAQRADEVGLDVFAIGEHHNPPFVPCGGDGGHGHERSGQDQHDERGDAATGDAEDQCRDAGHQRRKAPPPHHGSGEEPEAE